MPAYRQKTMLPIPQNRILMWGWEGPDCYLQQSGTSGKLVTSFVFFEGAQCSVICCKMYEPEVGYDLFKLQSLDLPKVVML